MKAGCYTALITPFDSSGELDDKGFEKLIDFQTHNGITGVLATGTTGESPTLHWEEHNKVVALAAKFAKGKCLSVAGTGSNNTREALEAARHAVNEGVDALLLVDPYYNGPSSLEIRREYYEPAAKAFPDTQIIPYIIPGRSGAQMMPQDLAILTRDYPNLNSVKEATGDLDNMKLTRTLCGDDFSIFSGDDGIIYQIMTDPQIKACGSISVMSNIAPGLMTRMVQMINAGDTDGAQQIQNALAPLLDLVVVVTQEESDFGRVKCRARNPLPLKTLMQLLGMPSGACRKPIGKMTSQGLAQVVSAAQKVWADNPEVFEPIATHFDLDIDDRLNNPVYRENLSYDY
ncbi:MAG: 4-hydroxy-tetrahydrodipicolinate synthase [Desulfobacteraceae bacterium]|nr:MAG: 4-hydroxy-tetrahydrodipicolinate synthase [Desulfobacteraceae bacterium]